MENEKTILFDIDKTLVNPRIFLDNFSRSLESCKIIGKDEFSQVFDSYKKELESSTDYDSDEFIRRISELSGKNSKEIQEISNDEKLWEDVVYKECREALEKLKGLGYSLGIYSEGFTSYQLAKLRLTGLDEFFEQELLFINRRKLDDDFIENLPDGATIVDDKKEVIERLNEEGRFNLVWINRVDGPEIEEIDTLDSLARLPDILERRDIQEEDFVGDEEEIA